MPKGGFHRGAVGQILLFISALLLSLSYLIATAIGFLEEVLLSIASYIFLLVFAVVFMTASNDLIDRFGGSRVGKTASTFGIVTSVVSIIAYFLLPIFPIVLISIIAVSMDHFAFGGIAILVGAFFLKYREYISNKELWGLVGIIYIVAGFALFISMARLYLPGFLSYLSAGYLLLLVGIVGIIGAISLFAAKPIGPTAEEGSTADQ